jgi:hypothetical protein
MMPPNNSMQRTALRAAADAERSADGICAEPTLAEVAGLRTLAEQRAPSLRS